MASVWYFNVTAYAVLFLLGGWNMSWGIVSKAYGEILIDEQISPPAVTLPQGTIRGAKMVSYRNKTFFAFNGIPYAKPPIGDLRFKDPMPPDPWNGTIDSNHESEQCIQFEPLIYEDTTGNEDCLYLNIYTPPLSTSNNIKQLPVMVYIFGGRFELGNITSTRCDPRFILDRNVILVVPSYRLGVLGFLTTGDEVLPGNYGLKDMVQALKWIQDNVQYFGGDANRVTLFGSSSGSVMVHLLTLSNLTDGLFHRYILQSGTAFTPAAMTPRSVSSNRAIRLGQYLACPTDSSNMLVNCLKGISASKLVKMTSMFHEWGQYPVVVWGPTIEPDVEGALLTDSPANLLAAGKIRDLPSIALVTRDEGLELSLPLFENRDVLQDFLNNIDFILPVMIQYEGLVENMTDFTSTLKSYYLNDLTANRSLILRNITQLIGDAMFTYPTYRVVKEQLTKAKNFQYFCSFEYRGRFSYSYYHGRFNYSYHGGSPVNHGVAHADELLYLLPGPKSWYGPTDWEYSDADWKMVDTMVQLWTSFATTGVPATLDSDDSTIWSPFSSRDNYLRIGNGSAVVLEVQYGFHKERIQVWDKLTRATTLK
ncbi:esterase E4-like [Neodiprion lecontei]|uniref:Carboxylic ester hydrolase n=1 Tax=Neodiprion lecontei TaxID=441921 RepID=A0ABM3FQL2_NEOLC|nr:esterase E4-like [Neodiprion lecontei]